MGKIAWLIFVRTEPVGAVSITDGAFSCLLSVNHNSDSERQVEICITGKNESSPRKGEIWCRERISVLSTAAGLHYNRPQHRHDGRPTSGPG